MNTFHRFQPVGANQGCYSLALTVHRFSIGALKGLYRGSIGENNLGDFCFFLIFPCFFGGLGVYIIPKWLIKVPGHIPILFG